MSFTNDSIFWVEVEKIVPNPFQPRREFNQEKLQELAESIRMYGILQPLTVTRREIQREDGAFYTEYELIAGERRLRASKLSGLSQVPVIIRDGEQSEQEKLELAIIENLQREDLNAVDRALAFKQLTEQFSLSHAKVAKKVGRSREYVSNTLRLLMLPDYMLDSLKIGDITEGHARTLLMLNDRPEELDVVYREILLKKLAVREVERIVRKIAHDKVRNKKWANTDPELIEIERVFTEALGTRVQIMKTDYGGKISIDYFSEDDLHKLLMNMQGEREAALQSVIAQASELAVGASEESAGMSNLENSTPLERVEETEVESGSPLVIEETVTIEESVVESGPPDVVESETRDEQGSELAVDDNDTTMTEDSPAPSQTDTTSDFSESEGTDQSPTDNPVENVTEKEAESETKNEVEEMILTSTIKEEDESDLYAIRNFNI